MFDFRYFKNMIATIEMENQWNDLSVIKKTETTTKIISVCVFLLSLTLGVLLDIRIP